MRNGARFGFDAEDFHTGMHEAPGPSKEEAIIAYLEGKYLPSCHYLTAASKGIAAAYQEKYGIVMPQVILNVFPFEDLPVRNADGPVRFYWYSQVIGPNRGVELLLEAAGRIGKELPFEIHLRGKVYGAGYKDALKELADKYGIWDRVIFHDPILSELIVRDANQFDVGMALESPISVNRNICVTNKIFSYLMSHLLIIGTDTFGQKDIFSHFPDAVRVCKVGDADGLAAAMRSCMTDRGRMLEGKMAARHAAVQAFNWELESKQLIVHVEDVLNKVIE
jgi:glycosyltransferase involved in cell wall biosynthesis